MKLKLIDKIRELIYSKGVKSRNVVSLQEVNIATVNSCTRKCRYCYHGSYKQTAVKFMKEEVFLKILKDLKDLNFKGIISPFEGNEPLLDKRLPDFVRLIFETLPETKCFVFTNGDLLTSEIAKKLFDAGLKEIFVSMHDKKNEEKVKKMIKIFGEDRIKISYMYQMKPEDLHNFAGVVKNDLVSQNKYNKNNCVLPFRQLVIDVNGNVNLCCIDIADRISFGNVKNKSVGDIFYKDEKLNNIRKSLNKNNRLGMPICKACSFNGQASLLEI